MATNVPFTFAIGMNVAESNSRSAALPYGVGNDARRSCRDRVHLGVRLRGAALQVVQEPSGVVEDPLVGVLLRGVRVRRLHQQVRTSLSGWSRRAKICAIGIGVTFASNPAPDSVCWIDSATRWSLTRPAA